MQKLYAFFSSVLTFGFEKSASRFGRFVPKEFAPRGLDRGLGGHHNLVRMQRKRGKYIALLGIEPWASNQQAITSRVQLIWLTFLHPYALLL
jgi:hypothetical protein